MRITFKQKLPFTQLSILERIWKNQTIQLLLLHRHIERAFFKTLDLWKKILNLPNVFDTSQFHASLEQDAFILFYSILFIYLLGVVRILSEHFFFLPQI